MQQSTNPRGEILDQRGVVSASAGLSPIPGRVRVTFDITPDAAYALSMRCTSAHLAGFAGAVDQAALWAQWGKPLGVDEQPANRTDPGE